MSARAPKKLATAGMAVLAAVAVTQTASSLGASAGAAGYPLAAPKGIHIASTSDDSIRVTWHSQRGAKLYRIGRSTSSSYTHRTYIRTRTPSVTMRGLDSATRYYFRIRAIRSNGQALSPNSILRTARTTGAAQSAPAPAPVANASSGPVDIRVASWNVLSVSLDKTSGEQRPWAQRRGKVLSELMGEHPDVIGLQEANQSIAFRSRLVDGDSQYRDIRNGLNKMGGHYAVTNDYANNCVRAEYSSNCTYKYRGASGDNRILYDTTRLSLVSQGSYKYAHQNPGGMRSLAWAVFQVRANGSRFFVTDTHLVPAADQDALRVAQLRELVSFVNKHKGSLPVINVGDYNVQKFDPTAKTVLPLMKSNGYGDILNQQYAVNPAVGVRAKRVIDGWINSNNRMRRDVSSYSYSTRHDKIGNNIDWIFASNSLAVPEWKTVVDFNPSTLQVNGVMPSDHNLVRATITIP